MRTTAARVMKVCGPALFAAACASAPSPTTDPQRSATGEPTHESAAPADEALPPRGAGARTDEPTGDIFPDDPAADAALVGPSSADDDAGGQSAPHDAGTDAAESDAAANASDAGPSRRCVRGSRTLESLRAAGQVSATVLMDERYIYWQQVASGGDHLRHDVMALPRAALHEPWLPATPIVITNEDYALGELVSANDGFLYFIAMQRGDRTNQGLFRVAKRERSALESLPVHGSANDYWPGQLALDERNFYLASVDDGAHTLRIVRVARVGFAREELWVDTREGNGGNTVGALSLDQADIALTDDHVYFTVRVTQLSAPHDFRLYRLDKQGLRQTPVLIATLEDTYGGLTSDGSHLYFSSGGNLEQWNITTQARERLTTQEGMLDLRHSDGVLSWTPTRATDDTLAFFCL